MSITHFPHGIFATPNLGAVGFGMSNASTIYFVDGTNGSDSNDGQSPEAAVLTIGKAISLADKFDVIYVVPKDWTSLENSYAGLNTAYAESCSISYAKAGLAIVGVGHADLLGEPHSVVLKETASGTAANMKVLAPMCAFENLAFERAGSETGGQLVFQGGTALTYEGNASSVYNCYFFYGNGSTGPGTTAGALLGDQFWGLNISHCSFMGCRRGIYLQSGAATTGDIEIDNCTFKSRLTAASDIEYDIYVYCQGSATVNIHDIFCAHLIPSYSGGGNRWIHVITERQGIVARVYCAGENSTAYTAGHAGTGIVVSANVGTCDCWDGGAQMSHA